MNKTKQTNKTTQQISQRLVVWHGTAQASQIKSMTKSWSMINWHMECTSDWWEFLPAVKFLYASEFDAVLAKSVIDRLKIDTTMQAYKSMGRCFEIPPPANMPQVL